MPTSNYKNVRNCENSVIAYIMSFQTYMILFFVSFFCETQKKKYLKNSYLDVFVHTMKANEIQNISSFKKDIKVV